MKILKFAFLFMGFISVANAADVTIYYSPTCPHCHHARDFFENEAIYEYDTMKVVEVNVMEEKNRQEFFDTLKKCGYESGGVPVIVVGEKCFQGYADSMQKDIRSAIEVDLTADQKKQATANKKEFDKNKDDFVAKHADRKSAVIEKVNNNSPKKKVGVKKPASDPTDVILFGLFGVLLVGLLVVLFKKQK